ncbi:polysaccharide deacetylase family protein [Dyella sp.]|uniref:polysaccharide deacetylase family protein n=1 Tax=Dyella sp. TaxID=1869338 RepID=UPI002D7E98DF|nr:polysaccharide deacetylase family protein [Dyella sp.]
MTLLKTDTLGNQTFHRQVLSAALTLLCGVCLVLFIERNTQRPHFALSEGHNSVTRIVQHDWRSAGDWIAGKKYAVLTFDDGPYGSGVDEKILDVLRKHRAHAIFFVICSRLDATKSDMLGELERDGHLIGNHSYDHLQLTKLRADELHQQIEGCSQRIARVTGRRPVYFRPPFGMTSDAVQRSAEASGMHQMLWNANSGDTWVTQSEQILHLSLEETDDQSILLMHDRPATAAILDETLTHLEQRGFEFVLPDRLPGEGRLD